ncbi:hypothetical protein [Tenacibaculum sp.]|uniref:hypothetical protein n=1 Tax=Tenacibaculum sp. TaxID=1906242 RepID=UPI003D13F3B7
MKKKNIIEYTAVFRYLFLTIIVMICFFKLANYIDDSGKEVQLIKEKLNGIDNIEFERQLKFREKILTTTKEEINKLDSVSNLSFYQKISLIDIEGIHSKSEIKIDTLSNIPTSFFYKFEALNYKYSINKFKFKKVTENIPSEQEFYNKIKYSDFIDINISSSKEFNSVKIAVYIIGFLLILLITYIPKYIFKETIEKFTVTDSEKDLLKSELKELNTIDSSSNEFKDYFNKKIAELNEKINSIIVSNNLISFININIQNANTLALETKNRASFMLLSGISIALIAVLFFYLSISKINFDTTYSFLTQSSKHFAILIFIESIAWFLLRQYRKIMNDYKFFYKVYQDKLKILELYRLNEESKLNKEGEIFEYLKNTVPIDFENEKNEVTNENNLFKIIQELLNKIK